MTVNWIELDGLVNLRDVGGIPTTLGGQIRERRLLRSDNLQDLTPADIDRLLGLGLSDVVDLRSNVEVKGTGPGPLHQVETVTIHHHSFLVEAPSDDDEEVIDKAVPTTDDTTLNLKDQVPNKLASAYVGFLLNRPESVLAALRAVSRSNGAALVHCAAGKDRTGATVAMSLALAGAEREAIVDDYAASQEKVDQILARLTATDTYAHLRDHSPESHATRPESMDGFLRYLEEAHGGVEPFLGSIGWTEDDTAQMRKHLLG